MVPANVLDKVVSEIKGQGLGIDNQYPFTSLGAKGTNAGGDAQQVLSVLTSSGKNLDEVISALSNIIPTMPLHRPRQSTFIMLFSNNVSNNDEKNAMIM
jgi:hypothetical protein